MLEILKRLWNFLLRHKRYFAEAEMAEPVLWQTGFRGTEFVIPRDRCTYKLFDLGAVQKELRDSALALQIRKWNPYASYHAYVFWNHNRAEVWATDTRNLKDENARFLPESIFVPRCENRPDVELLRVRHGVEGRIWQGDVLLFSKFWEDVPDITQWRLFLRGGGKQTQAVPEAKSLRHHSQPLHYADGTPALRDLLQEKVMVSAGLIVLCSVLGWQLTQLYLWQDAIQNSEAHLNNLNNNVGAVLESRAAATRNLKEIDAFNEIHGDRSVLSILADISSVIVEDSAFVEEFTKNGPSVSVRIKQTSNDLTDYVDALEQITGFVDVKAYRAQQRDTVVIELSLEGS